MITTKDIQEKFPFINVVYYGGKEYVGIVVSQDATITSMYDFNCLKTDEEKKLLIQLGEIWWWESNRMIPINIFLKREIACLDYSIIIMNTKDVKITLGPTVNLNNLAIKRVKRKSVQLVKNPKK